MTIASGLYQAENVAHAACLPGRVGLAQWGLYDALRSMASNGKSEMYPDYGILGKITGACPNTLKKYLTELEAFGLIKTRLRRGMRTAITLTNLMQLVADREYALIFAVPAYDLYLLSRQGSEPRTLSIQATPAEFEGVADSLPEPVPFTVKQSADAASVSPEIPEAAQAETTEPGPPQTLVDTEYLLQPILTDHLGLSTKMADAPESGDLSHRDQPEAPNVSRRVNAFLAMVPQAVRERQDTPPEPVPAPSLPVRAAPPHLSLSPVDYPTPEATQPMWQAPEDGPGAAAGRSEAQEQASEVVIGELLPPRAQKPATAPVKAKAAKKEPKAKRPRLTPEQKQAKGMIGAVLCPGKPWNMTAIVQDPRREGREKWFLLALPVIAECRREALASTHPVSVFMQKLDEAAGVGRSRTMNPSLGFAADRTAHLDVDTQHQRMLESMQRSVAYGIQTGFFSPDEAIPEYLRTRALGGD